MRPRDMHFGQASKITAEARGAAGQRRFNITVEAEGGRARVWVEKQELMQLALSIQELLSSQTVKQVADSRRRDQATTGSQDLEFQASRVVLGYAQDTDLMVLEFGDEESARRSRSLFRVMVDRSSGAAFAEQALEVCAAGRPTCPLCHGPIDPGGHVCVRTNGHIVA